MSNENIQVKKGIGKIENFNGDVHIHLDIEEEEKKNEKADITVSDSAPEVIKNIVWFLSLIKKNLFVGILVLIVFIEYLSKGWIYTQNKHFIETKILYSEITAKEKIILDNLQGIAVELQKYWNEIRDKEMHSSSYAQLIKSLFAVGFSPEQYLSMNDSSQKDLDKLQNYNLLRAKFKGYLENKYF